MSSSPLSGRVVLLSLGLAAVAWPLAWLLLAVAQGLGVLLAGGSFIGVSLPLGHHPWALVNQPSVAFASSRAALWGYWLAPALVALALAIALPLLAPTGRRWGGELLVNHLALAFAVLGLGWAPPLGLGDGPARGLERFFEIPPLAFLAGCALAGALSAPLVHPPPVGQPLARAREHHPRPAARRGGGSCAGTRCGLARALIPPGLEDRVRATADHRSRARGSRDRGLALGAPGQHHPARSSDLQPHRGGVAPGSGGSGVGALGWRSRRPRATCAVVV